MSGYTVVFGVATLVTLLSTPAVRWLAFRLGVVQAPDERRVHLKPTPVLGGLSM